MYLNKTFVRDTTNGYAVEINSRVLLEWTSTRCTSESGTEMKYDTKGELQRGLMSLPVEHQIKNACSYDILDASRHLSSNVMLNGGGFLYMLSEDMWNNHVTT